MTGHSSIEQAMLEAGWRDGYRGVETPAKFTDAKLQNAYASGVEDGERQRERDDGTNWEKSEWILRQFAQCDER